MATTLSLASQAASSAPPASPTAWQWGAWVVGGVALLVAGALVTPLHKLAPTHDAHRLLQVAAYALVFLVVAVVPSVRTAWLRRWQAVPKLARLVLWFVMAGGAVSALLAASPRYALIELVSMVALSTLVLLTATLAHERPKAFRQGAHVVLAVGVGIYLLRFAVTYAVWQPGWPYANLGMPHPRHFNHLLTWTLPLMVLLLGATGTARYRRVLGLVLGMGWVMLAFASGGRGTLAAVAVATLLTVALYRRQSLGWMAQQGTIWIAGFALFWVLFKVALGHESAQGLTRAGLSDRDLLWGLSWTFIQAQPWLGLGPMHFSALEAVNVQGLAAHPHNVVVQWAVEWGVPSTLLVLGLGGWAAVAWIRQSLKTEERTERLVRVALTASLLAGAAHLMLSGLLVMPLSQLVFALVAGWTLGLYQRIASPDTSIPETSGGLVPATRRARVAPAVFGALLIGWLALVVPEALRLQERHDAYVEQTDPQNLAPRFWQQGVIAWDTWPARPVAADEHANR
ncbi:MAG: O-antigen ligase family protein [Bacteroidota bacterium]